MNKKPLKEFYDPREKYLLLGNGINLISKGQSWGNLLKEITEKTHLKIDFNNKTYPLLFEEIAFKLRMHSHIEHNISNLKKIIGQICSKFNPNEIHSKIIRTNYYSHYLTTNYDYNLEQTISANYNPIEGKNKKNPKYSIHRYNKINETKIWHIHGEIDNGLRGNVIRKEESILIGNEHYGDYHRKIHELVKGEKGMGLHKLLQNAKENWVHLFFSRDIDILGFGMNFSESHLWFIINFRARLIRKGASIANTITWNIPTFSQARHKSKIDLLETLNVKVQVIDVAKDNYLDFYHKYIEIHS